MSREDDMLRVRRDELRNDINVVAIHYNSAMGGAGLAREVIAELSGGQGRRVSVWAGEIVEEVGTISRRRSNQGRPATVVVFNPEDGGESSEIIQGEI